MKNLLNKLRYKYSFFNIIHLEILSFFIYYLSMNLLNVKNRYSFNILSLFGYINAILVFVALVLLSLRTFEFGWHSITLFCILIFTLPVGYILTIFTYIYEELHENFRIKNEKFLSNKFIFIIQIIGALLSLALLIIFMFLIIRLYLTAIMHS